MVYTGMPLTCFYPIYLALCFVWLAAPALGAPLKLSKEISALINPCEENLLDSSAASAEAIRASLSRPDVARRIGAEAQHGVTVMLTNSNGQVLLSKRKGSHGAGQQVQQRGLAGTRRPDDRQLLARRHRERQRPQCRRRTGR